VIDSASIHPILRSHEDRGGLFRRIAYHRYDDDADEDVGHPELMRYRFERTN
jgi:hypothetical protein